MKATPCRESENLPALLLLRVDSALAGQTLGYISQTFTCTGRRSRGPVTRGSPTQILASASYHEPTWANASTAERRVLPDCLSRVFCLRLCVARYLCGIFPRYLSFTSDDGRRASTSGARQLRGMISRLNHDREHMGNQLQLVSSSVAFLRMQPGS